MSISDFNERAKAENLVIIDDLVLNVTDYMDNHPGGKFLLEHNIGRDISKFFYGGYALDNNDVRGGSMTYAHSNVARSIVETLVIARLIHSSDKSKSEGTEPALTFHAVINKREKVNNATHTIIFDIKNSVNKP